MAGLRQQVNAFVNTNLSPQARSARLAALAIQMRDDLISSGRAGPVYQTFVDGREGAPERSVTGTGGGTILYKFSYAAEAAVFALAFLRQRAPSRGGNLRNSFFVAINDRIVPAAQFDGQAVPPGAEIIIGNRAPYNRRADVQLDGDKRLSFATPAGMYDDAARAVMRQFGGTVTAKRVYSIDFTGRYLLRGEGRKKRGRGGKVESPALVITVSV